MTRFWVILSVAALMLPAVSNAKSSTNIMRGGYGFLFPDNNLFDNPGQFAISRGIAVEASYLTNETNSAVLATPSVVFGTGSYGLGARVQRIGSRLSSGTDFAQVGMGASFGKERVTLGAAFTRQVNGTRLNDGVLAATLTLNAPNRMGPSIGVGFETTIKQTGQDVRQGRFGLGYAFKGALMIEGFFRFQNLDSTSMWDLNGAVTYGSRFLYLGGLYTYDETTGKGIVAGRLGFILGHNVDLSAQVEKRLTDNSVWIYGGTLRASF